MFENIVSQNHYKDRYDIQVLSRPNLPRKGDGMNQTETTIDSIDGPWVVVLDNFLNSTEAQTLIDLGAAIGYKRSSDVGDVGADGSVGQVVSHARTSTNAWCNTVECRTDPVVLAVRERMTNLTGIDMVHSEALQLLRYVPGQHYALHHDYIAHEVSRRQGVRILTIFLYLNEVDEGGQTDFPRLHLSVTPKLGRALIWPSVLNEFPNKVDQRTEHRANRVMAGIKYGANAWIHQRAVLEDCL
jgi:prolyl 4-hydroxylase